MTINPVLRKQLWQSFCCSQTATTLDGFKTLIGKTNFEQFASTISSISPESETINQVIVFSSFGAFLLPSNVHMFCLSKFNISSFKKFPISAFNDLLNRTKYTRYEFSFLPDFFLFFVAIFILLLLLIHLLQNILKRFLPLN